MFDETLLQSFFNDILSRLSLQNPLTICETTQLSEDLQVDSLLSYELLIVVEELAGSRCTGKEPPVCETVGDLYAYFLQCQDCAKPVSSLNRNDSREDRIESGSE